MSLAKQLAAMGAPASLVDAVPDDPEDAWAWSERLEGSVWIGGAAAVALDEMLRVVSGLVAEALVQVPPAESLVLEALETAERCVRRQATRADCQRLAAACEEAAREAPATFRAAPPRAYRELVGAGAAVARAAEAIMSARLRDEAARMERARNSARLLGIGVDVFAPAADPAPRLDVDHLGHPIQAELLYVVAALAEAARLLEAAHAELDEPTGAALSAAFRERFTTL
ncbi:MAG: hypothetical protein CMN30_34395 [Sandaracinus sp.]|nr:hypothetical protein [Sandaracinus sp.]